jgi:MYXO-CTERM domain-containing protein
MAMVLFAGAREADAYVRYQTATGVGFALMPSCLPLPIFVYPGTFSQMTVDEVTGAVTAAAAAWSTGANPCTFIEFAVTVESGLAPRAANDRRNTIIFRDTSWCGLDSTGGCDPTRPYDPAAPAMTTVSARLTTGEILDADIEINALNFAWADRVAHPELVVRYDLQNVLTHEIGHLLGLDHSCFLAGQSRPSDNAGQPVPDCANAPASVQATTMFPSNVPGDLEKRTLEPDDRAAVCGIYPAAATPCPSGADAACTCAPPGTDGGQDAGDGGPDAPPTDALPGKDGGLDAGDGSPDAPSSDALPADAPSSDAGKIRSGGGCSCDAGGRSSERSWLVFLFLAAVLGAIIRRPRR